jgi:hypothetical protein
MADQSKIGEAYLELTVKDVDYIKKMANAEKSVKGLGASFMSFRNLASGIVGGAIAGFGVSSVKAFGEAEKADINLASALKLHGENVDALLPKLQQYASAIQKTTVYDDENVKGVMALASQLGIQGSQMEGVTKASIGLAEATGMGLEPAMRMIIKASQGHTETLMRYGISIDKTASKQEQFNQVLKFGSDSFALAEIRGNGLIGTMAKMGNSWSELKEKVGGFLAKTLDLPNVLNFWNDIMAKFGGSSNEAGAMVAGLNGIGMGGSAAADGIDEATKAAKAFKQVGFEDLWGSIQAALFGQGAEGAAGKIKAKGAGMGGTFKTPAIASATTSGIPMATLEKMATEAVQPAPKAFYDLQGGSNRNMPVGENQRLGVVIKPGSEKISVAITSITAEAAREIGKGIPFQWAP